MIISKKQLLAVLMVICLGLTVSQYAPKKAEAFLGSGVVVVVGDTSPTGVANSINITASHLKEYVLDKLAYIAAKEVLHRMTAETIQWINSGFEGKPAFLQNPRAFFIDTADQITGRMIADNGALANLCSPWNVDLRIRLALEQANDQFRLNRYTCTLDTVIQNARNTSVNATVDGFVGGDFQQGGFDAFMSMTVGGNNPISQYLAAKEDIQRKIAEQRAETERDLDRGSGFLTFSQCETIPFQSGSNPVASDGSYISDNGDGTGRKCAASTPGSVIAHSLGTALDAPFVEAELADDINSVLNALMSQLTSQIINKGLSSLSSRGSGISFQGRNNLDSYVSQLQTYSRTPYQIQNGSQTYVVQDGVVTSSGGTPAQIYASALSSLINALSDINSTRASCPSVPSDSDVAVSLDADTVSANSLLAEIRNRQSSLGVQVSNQTGDIVTANAVDQQVSSLIQTISRDISAFRSACGTASPIVP